MHNEVLKNLRIIPVHQILPFEWNPSKSSPSDLLECNHIRHPFLVSPIDINRYILLENAADFYAYQSAGVKEIPVQVVDSSKLIIQSGEIGLYAFEKDDLERLIDYAGGSIFSEDAKPDNKFLKLSEIDLEIGEKQKKLYLSNFESTDGCALSLQNLFTFLEKNGGYRLIKNKKSLSDSLTKIHLFKAKLRIPEIRLNHILQAAKSGNLFPPMILSVIAPVRMLNIDYPMTVLKADISTKEKEKFLTELLQLREETEKTSYYQGSIYLFNR